MKTHERNEKLTSTVSTAVEMLSAIAELDIDQESLNFTCSGDGEAIPDNEYLTKNISWINSSKSNDAIKIINDTFATVLSYLRSTLEDHQQKSHYLESIKTIMLLVSEAAKKFDRYRDLIDRQEHKSVTEYRPYKELQEFFQTKIMHQIGSATLGKWILGLSHRMIDTLKKDKKISHVPLNTRHTFVDIESIKRDVDYELFFIRKEDGNHFFNPRLIRNIKLICNFEDFNAYKPEKELLLEFAHLQNHGLQVCAQRILHSQNDLCELFYRNAYKFKNKQLVNILSKALMALMLAKESGNLAKEGFKDCRAYFLDFHFFLRMALQSPDYHRLITYPPNESNVVDNCIIDLVHGLCQQLYLSLTQFQEISSRIEQLIDTAKTQEANSNGREGWAADAIVQRLMEDHAALTKFLKKQLHGPLSKVLDALAEGHCSSFDPFLHENWPNKLFLINVDGQNILNLGLPSPTHQEYIHKVAILEEFKGFLRGQQSKHLIINLQDRTGWKEYFRCLALEDLQLRPEFENNLEVITLAKETDFYHQLSPYDKDNHAEMFFRHIKEHLGDVNSGFYFTPAVKKEVLSEFCDGVIKAIHRLFFSSKNILLREHRLAFIDLFDVFIILKAIDVVKPFSFSLTCKDGIDNSTCCNVLLYLFLKMISPEPLSAQDWQQINMMLYAPALLVRERTVENDSFKRMIDAVKVLELVYHEHGHHVFGQLVREAFGLFFSSSILNGNVLNTHS